MTFKFPDDKYERFYVWVPICGAFMWCGQLLAMLLTWVGEGTPVYISESGTVPFISDIGADILKPLFVTGCIVTATTFVLSLVLRRRVSGRAKGWERACTYAAILGGSVGGLGLVLLSGFDTKRHWALHRHFLYIFIGGVGASALCTVLEFRWMRARYRAADAEDICKRLDRAFTAKAVLALVLIAVAIAFGIENEVDPTGAILEWMIAFGFTLYFLTFAYDMRLARALDGAHPEKGEREHI
ncbi:Frag1/DRAM/Sfk1 [Amylostereum chailletii]|nr:Frag1/DRAM/Sfk1 [Amylostereum chailletii]